MDTVFQVLNMVWQFFSDITCPFLGISFASLFLGVAVINFSIRILKPLLGLGGSIAKSDQRTLIRLKAKDRARGGE